MRRSRDEKTFGLIGGGIVTIFAIICLVPFLFVISGSLSGEAAVRASGYTIFPREFTFEAYKMLFADPVIILRAYALTITITVVSIAMGLFINSMTGYALHRKDFAWRNGIALYFYFTCLFSGGMVPSYILNISLGMRDNPLVLVIGSFFGVFNAFMIRNYMSSLPESLMESAKIDGAGDFTIYWRIILPLCTPVLATIALFLGLGAWNSWGEAMLYISDERLYPLQYVLYRMLNMVRAREMMRTLATNSAIDFDAVIVMPDETLKLATTVVVTGPIVFAYPFVQKYFVRGIVVGAVKG